MEHFIFLLLILSLAIQLGYFFLFLRILFHKEKYEPSESAPVSVVIAAHNEKKNLEKLIPTLLKQSYPDFEIIIVDDRSSDGTGELVKKINDPRLKVISISTTPSGFNPKKYALTRAIEVSKNDNILLTDADCLPLSDKWIENMIAPLNKKRQIVLGYSGYEFRRGFLNMFLRYETFLTAVQYFSFALAGAAYMGVGRNLAYRKKIFIENNGYTSHKDVTGGDDDLFIGTVAAGTESGVVLKKDGQTISIPKESFKDFFRQKLRHLGVGKKYILVNKIKSGLFPFTLILFYISFVSSFFMDGSIYAALTIIILRTSVLITIFALISRKLGENINWLWFPVLDLSYLLYYLIVGISAFFSKKTKWI